MQPPTKISLDKTLSTHYPEEYVALIKIWQTQVYEQVLPGYGDNIGNNPALLKVLNNSPCVTMILNLSTQRFEFVSSNASDLFGYGNGYFLEQGLPFCNSIAHPEDLQNSWKLIKSIWDFIFSVPPADQAQYKFTYDFRTLRPSGKVVRVLAQNSILQTDNKGTITHVLCVYSDISHWKKSNYQLASIVSTVAKSCLFFSQTESDSFNPSTCLSKRELEIVKLMAEGFSSKLIADKLFISFHTVNTHRQKIMEKTKTRNTGGLVQFAVSHGLI
ncbi:LuxR C-terminal-related transcriptional regulator [Pontibacter beigongshangensis]|uniref:LuxR C-terminal-related transcriptional regulator n=1 Tax=Pontibacter beigongshangensis TaxID=2574733 RepID=UPI00164F995F|nr:LuxR C-terminal-related transcriptional regulator [Pontibacter beigongshangensis]